MHRLAGGNPLYLALADFRQGCFNTLLWLLRSSAHNVSKCVITHVAKRSAGERLDANEIPSYSTYVVRTDRVPLMACMFVAMRSEGVMRCSQTNGRTWTLWTAWHTRMAFHQQGVTPAYALDSRPPDSGSGRCRLTPKLTPKQMDMGGQQAIPWTNGVFEMGAPPRPGHPWTGDRGFRTQQLKGSSPFVGSNV